jgi:hypothetical protein
MNYLKYLRNIVILLFIILSACKGDNEGTDNIISFYGAKFKLNKAYEYKYSDILETGSTPFVVMMMSRGVTYNETTDELTGIGSMISFKMYSENQSEIKQGFYTIDIFSLDSIYTADECEVYYNYDFQQDTGHYYNVNSGTIEVENLGSVMKYDMNLVCENLIMFSGTYRGPMITVE